MEQQLAMGRHELLIPLIKHAKQTRNLGHALGYWIASHEAGNERARPIGRQLLSALLDHLGVTDDSDELASDHATQ